MEQLAKRSPEVTPDGPCPSKCTATLVRDTQGMCLVCVLPAAELESRLISRLSASVSDALAADAGADFVAVWDARRSVFSSWTALEYSGQLYGSVASALGGRAAAHIVLVREGSLVSCFARALHTVFEPGSSCLLGSSLEAAAEGAPRLVEALLPVGSELWKRVSSQLTLLCGEREPPSLRRVPNSIAV
jgi:hypothetical protein